MSIVSAIIVLFLLILFSAFVSSSELSLASARKIKLQNMSKDGDLRAIEVLKLQDHPGSFITAVQIVMNAIAILAGVVGEATLRPYFMQLVGHELAASLLSFTLVTSLFILFADLMPKRMAMTQPEQIAVRLVRPMLLLIFIFKPFIWVFDGLATLLFKILGVSTVRQDHLTYDDIFAVMDAGAKAGVLNQQEHHLIENIFDMQERTVTSTMNTRENIIFFDINESSEVVLETIDKAPHRRYLVCDGVLEKVLGYFESHTLLTLVLKEQQVKLNDKRVLQPVLFIPDTLTLYEVLETFKNTGNDFAVVVNEYALVVGVVSLKDVMSIVMGELVTTIDERQIIQRTEDSWLIDGVTPLEDVMRELDIMDFPNSQNYETIGGFMMYTLRKIPKKTDSVELGDFRFEIIDTEHLKIDQLLVTKLDKG